MEEQYTKQVDNTMLIGRVRVRVSYVVLLASTAERRASCSLGILTY